MKNYPIYVKRPIELDVSIYDAVVRIHTYLVRNNMGGLTIHILKNLSLRTVRNKRFNTQKNRRNNITNYKRQVSTNGKI